MALGARDTGKSTLIRWLARSCAQRGLDTWLVDADVGQSDIGPPTTVGATRMGGTATHLAFVGDHSPRGHLLQVVGGTAHLVQLAMRERADVVLVNTTGYVDDGAAAALKIAKIDVLRPELIVALPYLDTLDRILRAYRDVRTPRVVALQPSSSVRPRGPEVREAYRRQAWASYLEQAEPQVVDLQTAGLSGADPETLASKDQRGRVAALFDESNACTAVGPVLDFDAATHVMRILAPRGGRVHRVALGSIAVPGFE
jgi:polynucleotide 5'-hydroxyl-kinase GRC3/NOL9